MTVVRKYLLLLSAFAAVVLLASVLAENATTINETVFTGVNETPLLNSSEDAPVQNLINETARSNGNSANGTAQPNGTNVMSPAETIPPANESDEEPVVKEPPQYEPLEETMTPLVSGNATISIPREERGVAFSTASLELLGPELVPNGDFTPCYEGWGFALGGAYRSGTAHVFCNPSMMMMQFYCHDFDISPYDSSYTGPTCPANDSFYPVPSISVQAGKKYRVSMNVMKCAGGSYRVVVGGNSTTPQTLTGLVTFDLIAVADGNLEIPMHLVTYGGSWNVPEIQIDDVSVKEIYECAGDADCAYRENSTCDFVNYQRMTPDYVCSSNKCVVDIVNLESCVIECGAQCNNDSQCVDGDPYTIDYCDRGCLCVHNSTNPYGLKFLTATSMSAGADNDCDGINDWWETAYGYSTNNPLVPSSTVDTDADGVNDYNEGLQGTNPGVSDSFRIRTVSISYPNIIMTMNTFYGNNYSIEGTASLTAPNWTTVARFFGADATSTNVSAPMDGPVSYYRAVAHSIESECAYKPKSTGMVRLNSSGLFVNGSEFTIKGVGYQPTPIGESVEWGYNMFAHPELWARDFPLLRNMNANTIRTWGKVTNAQFLIDAWHGGDKPIYVIMGYWLDSWNNDYSDPTTRANILSDFRTYVQTYKDYPAVLMWAIGNEDNLALQSRGINPSDFYSLCDEMAEAAYEAEGAAYHPVVIINGDVGNIGDPAKHADDLSLTYVDAWAMNTYPGSSLTAKINEYSTKSAKPLYISEYGIDAYNDSADAEYGSEQAEWDLNLWRDIANSNITIGGTVMAYSDEWWKGIHSATRTGCPDSNAAYHSDCGYPTANHPDGYANEEWWGIVRPVDNGANPDIMQPRQVYYALASEFAKGDRTIPFQEGFVYTSWWYNDYLQAKSDTSLGWMKDDGANYVSILVTWYQDTTTSTSIYSDASKTPTDAAVIDAIQMAHGLGMKVALKPHVDVKDGSWRGDISFSSESDWKAWFSSYTAFINHYADLAEANGVEGFVIGTELKATEGRESDWRVVVGNARTKFPRWITYAANHDSYQSITWWDALDFIGVDAYFALTAKTNPTVAELVAAWAPYKSALSSFSASKGKPIVFTEIGYQSVDGTNMHPWWSSGAMDQQEQADCYQAAFQVFYNETWFKGMYWWMWYWDPAQDVNKFDVYNKLAEAKIIQWYGGIPKVLATPSLSISGIPDKTIYANGRVTQNIFYLPDYVANSKTATPRLKYRIKSQSNSRAISCSVDSKRYVDCKASSTRMGSSTIVVEVAEGTNRATDSFVVTSVKGVASLIRPFAGLV